jgi:hypothetical protein
MTSKKEATTVTFGCPALLNNEFGATCQKLGLKRTNVHQELMARWIKEQEAALGKDVTLIVAPAVATPTRAEQRQLGRLRKQLEDVMSVMRRKLHGMIVSIDKDYGRIVQAFADESLMFKERHEALGKLLDKALEAQRRAKVPDSQLEKLFDQTDKYLTPEMDKLIELAMDTSKKFLIEGDNKVNPRLKPMLEATERLLADEGVTQ